MCIHIFNFRIWIQEMARNFSQKCPQTRYMQFSCLTVKQVCWILIMEFILDCYFFAALDTFLLIIFNVLIKWKKSRNIEKAHFRIKGTSNTVPGQPCCLKTPILHPKITLQVHHEGHKSFFSYWDLPILATFPCLKKIANHAVQKISKYLIWKKCINIIFRVFLLNFTFIKSNSIISNI
jgi:hypothetical protein